MANFLHIITTKAELGHTEVQIEPFIVDSLKVPSLPEGESLWVLDLSELNDVRPTSHMITKQNYMNSSPNRFSKLCWPPVSWKKSPGLPPASDTHLSEIHEALSVSNTHVSESHETPSDTHLSEICETPSASDTHLSESHEAPSASDTHLKLSNANNMEDLPVPSMVDEVVLTSLELPWPDTENEMLWLKNLEEDQAYKTGRLGEMIAYRYFTEKLGEAAVKWLNGDSEMGLPYDLIIEQESSKVYVEVKTTIFATKNWFPLSVNEWLCAVKKKESFMIARVILSSPTNAKVLIFKNPVKLCQQKELQLALIQLQEPENHTS